MPPDEQQATFQMVGVGPSPAGSLGTASTNPNIPVSQLDNRKAQRFEGVASQSVTSGTVGTLGVGTRVVVRFISRGRATHLPGRADAILRDGLRHGFWTQ